jgi:hypothetical protein
VQNFSASTATPYFSTDPPTTAVDKISGLSCGNGLIHRFHNPYYYDDT